MQPVIAHVVGARPNYMKIAPIWVEVNRAGFAHQRLIHTGQHYDELMSDVFFRQLPLPAPDVRLDVGAGRHGAQTARALVGLEQAFLDIRPDVVVVAGDVNSTLAGALAAVKLGIPVCHVEAGLRSFDETMPEEHNRRLTDHVSSLLLTHSPDADVNLEREGIAAERIRRVGNTMIDSLLVALPLAREARMAERLGLEPSGFALVTLHRPALVDDVELLRTTIAALDELDRELPVVFSAHPRTAARLQEAGIVPQRIKLLPPLPYLDFISLEAAAAAVVTDSGGVQEETTALGVPCFTLRENTERPITVIQGTNMLLGLDPQRVLEIPRLLADRSPAPSSVWDGHAGGRAAVALEKMVAQA